MAQRATPEGVANDARGPRYREAVKLLGTIDAKKSKVAEMNGQIAAVYDKMEGYKVNKKAAKIFHALSKLEGEEQADIIRSFQGLIDAAGWQVGDLVDQAEGSGQVISANFGGRRGATEPAGDDADDDGGESDDPVTEPQAEAAPTPKKKRESPAERSARMAAAFANGEAPAGAPPAEEYQGDNSDLSGE